MYSVRLRSGARHGETPRIGGNPKNQPISELDIFSKCQALSRAVVVNSNMSRWKYLAREGPGSRLRAVLIRCWKGVHCLSSAWHFRSVPGRLHVNHGLAASPVTCACAQLHTSSERKLSLSATRQPFMVEIARLCVFSSFIRPSTYARASREHAFDARACAKLELQQWQREDANVRLKNPSPQTLRLPKIREHLVVTRRSKARPCRNVSS